MFRFSARESCRSATFLFLVERPERGALLARWEGPVRVAAVAFLRRVGEGRMREEGREQYGEQGLGCRAVWTPRPASAEAEQYGVAERPSDWEGAIEVNVLAAGQEPVLRGEPSPLRNSVNRCEPYRDSPLVLRPGGEAAN